MAKSIKNVVLGALYGLFLAVIVTACVKNDNKDGVAGENGEKLISPLKALQVSENGVSVKNQVTQTGAVYKAIEQGWTFETQSEATLKISMEEDLVMQNCKITGDPVSVSFKLRINNQAPGVDMLVGKSYQVPAGKHMVVLTINNKRLCPNLSLTFLARISRNLLNTNVGAKKIKCRLAARPRKRAIIKTRPFELAIVDRHDSSRNRYIIDQRIDNHDPTRNEKVFCREVLNQAQCETSKFEPKQSLVNLIAGYNTTCEGLSAVNGQSVNSKPAQLLLKKRIRGGQEKVEGTFSCMIPHSKKTLVRRLRNCKTIYDHGESLVHTVNSNNNFNVNYSCLNVKINFDLTLEQMKSLPEVVYWNIYDTSRDQYILREWNRADRKAVGSKIDELQLVVRKARRDRSGFRSNIVRSYMRRDFRNEIDNMRIVFRNSDDAFGVNFGIGHINLGELLKSNPDSFFDKSARRRRCN